MLRRALRRYTARQRPTRFPSPSCNRNAPPLSAYLQDLTERARGYVEIVSSTNTQKLGLRLEALLHLAPAAKFLTPPLLRSPPMARNLTPIPSVEITKKRPLIA